MALRIMMLRTSVHGRHAVLYVLLHPITALHVPQQPAKAHQRLLSCTPLLKSA